MPYRSTEATRRSAEAKRTEFLRAARSVVAANGFAGATVAAIATESGASVGSVYSYFDNREYLLAEVFRSAAGHELDAVRRAVEAVAPDPSDRLAALIDTFAHRALQGRQLAWSLLFEPVIAGVDAERLIYRQSYRALGEDIIRDGMADGVFVDQDVEVSASAVMGAISEALVGALSPLADRDLRRINSATAADEIVEQIRGFCFRALGTAPPTTTSRRGRKS